MTGTGATKAKSGNLEAEEGLREQMEQQEERRRSSERDEQQDLNQGMETGTHSSAHHGVNWGPSYRMRPKIDHPLPIKEQIAARAYELYVQRGGEDGHDLEDWLLAEEELKQELTKAN
jgi:Protein of unknown function (DUF2934)